MAVHMYVTPYERREQPAGGPGDTLLYHVSETHFSATARERPRRPTRLASLLVHREMDQLHVPCIACTLRSAFSNVS